MNESLCLGYFSLSRSIFLISEAKVRNISNDLQPLSSRGSFLVDASRSPSYLSLHQWMMSRSSLFENQTRFKGKLVHLTKNTSLTSTSGLNLLSAVAAAKPQRSASINRNPRKMWKDITACLMIARTSKTVVLSGWRWISGLTLLKGISVPAATKAAHLVPKSLSQAKVSHIFGSEDVSWLIPIMVRPSDL